MPHKLRLFAVISMITLGALLASDAPAVFACAAGNRHLRPIDGRHELSHLYVDDRSVSNGGHARGAFGLHNPRVLPSAQYFPANILRPQEAEPRSGGNAHGSGHPHIAGVGRGVAESPREPNCPGGGSDGPYRRSTSGPGTSRGQARYPKPKAHFPTQHGGQVSHALQIDTERRGNQSSENRTRPISR